MIPRSKCFVFNSDQLSLIKSAVDLPPRLESVFAGKRVWDSRNACLLNIFYNQTYILSVFNDETSKMIFLNKSIFTFNDTGLDSQRFDKKIN